MKLILLQRRFLRTALAAKVYSWDSYQTLEETSSALHLHLILSLNNLPPLTNTDRARSRRAQPGARRAWTRSSSARARRCTGSRAGSTPRHTPARFEETHSSSWGSSHYSATLLLLKAHHCWLASSDFRSKTQLSRPSSTGIVQRVHLHSAEYADM